MVRIITDSVASIPADEARKAGIEVVTLYVNRDGEELADAEMDLDAFYADIYSMVPEAISGAPERGCGARLRRVARRVDLVGAVGHV